MTQVAKDSPGPSDVHVPSTGTKPKAGKKAMTFLQARAIGKRAPARKLEPIDDERSKTPFAYDGNVLGRLREDQVPRFFGALTDSDKLPTQTVQLADLTAMQNRVDHGKVAAIRGTDGARGKKAVVIAMDGKQYIADGHHRLTADWLDGKSEAEVAFKDLEPVSNAMKRDVVWTAPFTVAKSDPVKRLVFGWFSVVEIAGQPVIDKQNDVIAADELERAVYDFVLNARAQGSMHETIGVGRLVESMMFTAEKQQALGIDLGKVGWWGGFFVDDDATWAAIKNGELPEFSIGGQALKEEIPDV